MPRYAEATKVSSSDSRAEIERTLSRYGATGFMYGWEGNQALVAFKMNDRHVKFVLPMPPKSEFSTTPSRGWARSPEQVEKAWEQACRQRWRALALVVKAKLEAVAAGITVFEDEFLAHIVLPDGQTAGQWIKPQLAVAYESGQMPPLLPYYGEA